MKNKKITGPDIKSSEKKEKNVMKAKHLKEKDTKPKRVFSIIKNILCWSVIAVLAITLISFMMIRVSGGTPNIFGYTIQRISSGSMEPELKVGDIILSKKVSSPDELKIDDIITFKGGAEYDHNNVTHRIIIAPIKDESGNYFLTTKGDANDVSDAEIRYESVQSKYVKTLGFLNKFFDFFLSPWGLIVFLLTLLLIFFDELVNFIRIISGNYPDEDEESISDIIERLQQEERKKTEIKSETENDT